MKKSNELPRFVSVLSIFLKMLKTEVCACRSNKILYKKNVPKTVQMSFIRIDFSLHEFINVENES